MPLTIRPAQLSDTSALSTICAATANAGQAPTPALLEPELPGLLYALPYLHGPACFALVAEDDQGVCGYAVGTADSQAYYNWLNHSWLATHNRAPGIESATELDLRFAAGLQRAHAAPSWHKDFPAHLHLNLLPRAQGQGAGRALMSQLISQLAQAGASGVHWGADPANLGALGFYRKLGYKVYASEPGCIWFASVLAAESPDH